MHSWVHGPQGICDQTCRKCGLHRTRMSARTWVVCIGDSHDGRPLRTCRRAAARKRRLTLARIGLVAMP